MRKRNIVAIVVIVLFIAVVLISFFSKSAMIKEEIEKEIQHVERFYAVCIEIFEVPDIWRSMQESGAVEEYRIVMERSFVGREYYSFQVFADGTGRLTYLFFRLDAELEGDRYVSVYLPEEEFRTDLTPEETTDLLGSIQKNKFYRIPVFQYSTLIGLDGETLFIEGSDGETRHLVERWCPGDREKVMKIYYSFVSLLDEKQGVK